MKNKNNISRRDFLLVEYIREVLNPTRRSFGGMLGGAFAMALGINPNKSQAKSLNKIENKIEKIAKKFLNINGIKSSVFVVEGRVLKFKITLEDEELNEIILNENEAFALSSLSEDYLDKTILKINKSSESGEDAFYNIKDFIEFLGEDYKSNKSKKSKSKSIEIEEIDLDLSDEKELNFRSQCLKAIKRRKNSDPLICMILEVVFKKEYCIIKKSTRGNYNIIDFTLNVDAFFNKRDDLLKTILENNSIKDSVKEDFKDYVDNFEEDTPSNVTLKTRKSGEEFIEDFIKSVKKFISINKSEVNLGQILGDVGLISVNFYTSEPWQNMEFSFKR